MQSFLLTNIGTSKKIEFTKEIQDSDYKETLHRPDYVLQKFLARNLFKEISA